MGAMMLKVLCTLLIVLGFIVILEVVGMKICITYSLVKS
jgi:hypothetical protein